MPEKLRLSDAIRTYMKLVRNTANTGNINNECCTTRLLISSNGTFSCKYYILILKNELNICFGSCDSGSADFQASWWSILYGKPHYATAFRTSLEMVGPDWCKTCGKPLLRVHRWIQHELIPFKADLRLIHFPQPLVASQLLLVVFLV